MLKQIFINKYFNKLTTDEFLQNDEDAVIGKAKDVIEQLKEHMEGYKKAIEENDKEVLEEWITEDEELISEIEKEYPNKEDIVGIAYHFMAGTFLLQDRSELLEDLKKRYKEMKED